MVDKHTSSQLRIFRLFCRKLYEKPNVADACISLECKYCIDYNILFFCCWVAERYHHCLSPVCIERLICKVNPWRECIILPLRKLRQSLNCFSNSTKLEKVLSLIDENICFVERVIQAYLIQNIPSIECEATSNANKFNRALNGIFNYLNNRQIKLHKIDLEKIYRIVKKCFLKN